MLFTEQRLILIWQKEYMKEAMEGEIMVSQEGIKKKLILREEVREKAIVGANVISS